jgi:hypothetical protein
MFVYTYATDSYIEEKLSVKMEYMLPSVVGTWQDVPVCLEKAARGICSLYETVFVTVLHICKYAIRGFGKEGCAGKQTRFLYNHIFDRNRLLIGLMLRLICTRRRLACHVAGCNLNTRVTSLEKPWSAGGLHMRLVS